MRNKWRSNLTRRYGGHEPAKRQLGTVLPSENTHKTQTQPQFPPPPPVVDRTRQSAEYDFLRRSVISDAGLDYAGHLAELWGSPIHEVLISLGWIRESTYCQALANHLGIEFLPPEAEQYPLLPKSRLPVSIPVEPTVGLSVLGGVRKIILNGRALKPGQLADIISRSGHPRQNIAITTQIVMRKAERRQNGPANLEHAVGDLAKTFPALSSSTGLWPSQALSLSMLMGMFAGAVAISPRLTVVFIMALLTLPFLIIVILRLATIIIIFLKKPPVSKPGPQDPQPPTDAELPIYSVLVPLYKEHEILPDLICALKMIDYPATKLDIKIILEHDDHDTIGAANAANLPGNFDIVIVPEGGPRTKPKALNYALAYARGAYLVIYDAEDEPEPDQLRRALEMFRLGGPDTACIQAQLNIYNPRQTWLTRQFTIEYTSLFDGLLPAFESLSLPILLGGTSNHFRTSTLRNIGGWDPYNVTEDADLGIRILRRGLRSHILPSTTYEEAPSRFIPWMKQRTRWLKGWLQTYLVHTRNTARLRRELGFWRYIGFKAILGGAILSALIHPLFYIGLYMELTTGDILSKPSDMIGRSLWHVALFNLSLGYLAAIILGWVTLFRRGIPRLIIHTIGMPVYWLLISLAAYRALFQLFWKPFLWEKTDHSRSKYRSYKPG